MGVRRGSDSEWLDARSLARLALEAAADPPAGGHVHPNPPEKAREHADASMLTVFETPKSGWRWWRDRCVHPRAHQHRNANPLGLGGGRCVIFPGVGALM